MGSWIMGSIGYGDQIYQIDKSQTTFSYIMYIEAHSVIIIRWLLESDCLCPKVIPLSGLHFIWTNTAIFILIGLQKYCFELLRLPENDCL